MNCLMKEIKFYLITPSKLFVCCCLIFIHIKLYATTYTTAVNGNWNNPGCWLNAAVPNLSFSDTIIIKHHIVLSADLTLLNGAHLSIESTGGICGHVQFFVQANAGILKYGILEIDVLNMTGGDVNLLPPGNAIFTQYGVLTGGSLHTSCDLSVGPWFDCQMPEYQFLNGLNDTYEKLDLNLFPNPSMDNIAIDLPASATPFQLIITDVDGAIVLQKQMDYKHSSLNLSELKPGLYHIQLIGQATHAVAKFIKK